MNMTSDQFNEKYEVGTPVVYQPVQGGEGIQTKTRSIAWDLGSGDPVVSVAGKSGGVALSHVTVISVIRERKSDVPV